MSRTGIICTIGPASNSEATLRKMIFAGMDVVRLNFSHGTWAGHKKVILLIRKLNKKYRRNIKILLDLEGFRIRIGKLVEPVTLKKHQILTFSNDKSKLKPGIIPFDYNGSVKDIKPGKFIYIDDGLIALKVLSAAKGHLRTVVIVPGTIKEHKGINIPDIKLNFSGLTKKDKKDIGFAVKNKVDFIAQSFVRNERDILPIKKLIKNKLPNCKIIAKIENREGLLNINSLISVCDGIMVARGDMGVSLPIWEVPIRQKELIILCRRAKKISITATQMLESMTEQKRPTRAEVADVANAVLDGSSYVMLSAESAAGKNPVEAVQMMSNIIKYTESSWFFR